MLIKLDSGDYVNTALIEQLFRSDEGWCLGENHGESNPITEADKDRIVAAMEAHHE